MLESRDQIRIQLIKDYGKWGQVFHVNELFHEGYSPLKDLFNKGFSKTNSRLVMCVCSDEINRTKQRNTIENALNEQFGEEFHLGTLGAYPIGGVSGITAVSHHVPIEMECGKEKHGNIIFYISPHMGLTIGNEIRYGYIYRPCQKKLTPACGVLMNFLKSLRHIESINEITLIEDDYKDDGYDIAKNRLFKDLLENYKEEIIENLHSGHINNSIIKLSKLNYKLVITKFNKSLDLFLEREPFDGKIALIGGITINTEQDDFFILKNVKFFSKD